MSAVDVDEVAAVFAVGAHELGHGLRRVAEMDEKPTGEAASHEGRHLVGVLVNAQVERVDDGVTVGRQKAERAVAEVEARLADAAYVRPAGQIVEDLELRRLLERVSFDHLVERRLVHGCVERR